MLLLHVHFLAFILPALFTDIDSLEFLLTLASCSSALATAATSLPPLVALWNFARFQVRINIPFFGHTSKSASCHPLTNHMLPTPSFLELCKCPENGL